MSSFVYLYFIPFFLELHAVGTDRLKQKASSFFKKRNLFLFFKAPQLNADSLTF